MLRSLRRLWRTRALKRQIERNIQAGVGLHRQEWVLADRPVTDDALAAMAARICTWCAETMARTRRPYGLDQMAVAVACAREGGEPVASASFGVFRPVEFYQEGGTRDRIAEFLVGLDPRDLNQGAEPLRFAAALFSWGDVARAVLFEETP